MGNNENVHWIKEPQFTSLQNDMTNAFSCNPRTGTRMVCRKYHNLTTKEKGNMDSNELQTNSMPANHLQHPHTNYHIPTI